MWTMDSDIILGDICASCNRFYIEMVFILEYLQ